MTTKVKLVIAGLVGAALLFVLLIAGVLGLHWLSEHNRRARAEKTWAANAAAEAERQKARRAESDKRYDSARQQLRAREKLEWNLSCRMDEERAYARNRGPEPFESLTLFLTDDLQRQWSKQVGTLAPGREVSFRFTEFTDSEGTAFNRSNYPLRTTLKLSAQETTAVVPQKK